MIYKTLSIIIPVYNEEKTVVELLEKLKTTKLSLKKEIVIVNDGSTDNSEKLIKNWIATNDESIFYFSKNNGGKGSAVKYGIERSSGDIVIIQDADLEYNPDDIERCIKPIISNEAKIVYGSRELSETKRTYSYFSFFLGGLLVTNWINFLYGTGLTDEPTCYKTFDGNLIRTLLFEKNGFEWEPEITCKLIRLGYIIKEVGISYTPRNIEEGKKINSLDGFKALLVALIWKFKFINKEKIKISKSKYQYLLNHQYKTFPALMLFIFILALSVRLFVVFPGISSPLKTFSRPDSPTYINPALSLLNTGNYSYSVKNHNPYAYRPPGYPFYLALILSIKDSFKLPVIISCILSAFTCLIIFKIGLGIGGKWTAFLSSLLMALNVTAISHAPLFLSDTLFLFIISIQFWYFIKFIQTKGCLFLFLSVFLASIATYIRTIELLWIIPCIFLILIFKNYSLKKRILISALTALLFLVPILPWMIRNYYNNAGFNLSTDTGNLLYNNGAILLGQIYKKSPELIRQNLHKNISKVFKDHPEKFKSEANRVAYEKQRLKELIYEHPFTYFKLCFRPWILTPDLPTFYQNLGFTTHGRGTFDILNTQGITAAVKYYFKGNMWLIIVSIPLLLIILLTYIGCLLQLIQWIIKRNWYLIFIALAFIEYYFFLPGPVTMPRYQLPALPMICLMAGLFFSNILKYKVRKKSGV